MPSNSEHPLDVNRIIQGDALAVLKTLPSQAVNCIVTSPPYWGLRDYGVDGQLGLEETPEEYTERLVTIFREARRVLRDDGTLWLNLGDTYAANRSYQVTDNKHIDVGNTKASSVPKGLKPKDLVGIPWRVAFALQADGWYLRADIIWSKPNPMPESVTDRPTKAHEYIFLLSKSSKYYYDCDAIREPYNEATLSRYNYQFNPEVASSTITNNPAVGAGAIEPNPKGRNKRTVWEQTTQPCPDAHFAVYPERLITPCILAGCPRGGVVLDPFMGAGTTAIAAKRNHRDYLGIELNQEYITLAEGRIKRTYPDQTIWEAIGHTAKEAQTLASMWVMN